MESSLRLDACIVKSWGAQGSLATLLALVWHDKLGMNLTAS